MDVPAVITGIGNIVSLVLMSFYGSIYLEGQLRRHKGKAPRLFMIVQFACFWLATSFLYFFYGHTGFNAIWLGALNSAGATTIGTTMYRHNKRKAEGEESPPGR